MTCNCVRYAEKASRCFSGKKTESLSATRGAELLACKAKGHLWQVQRRPVAEPRSTCIGKQTHLQGTQLLDWLGQVHVSDNEEHHQLSKLYSISQRSPPPATSTCGTRWEIIVAPVTKGHCKARAGINAGVWCEALDSCSRSELPGEVSL